MQDRFPVIRYRSNVAGILVDAEGKILICERIDKKGCWQFPQGGVDRGEKKKAAVFREIEEEIGVKRKHLEIVKKRSGYRYQFPGGRIKWGIYRGQEQKYYLLRYSGKKGKVDLSTKHPEFRDHRWIEPGEFSLEWVPEFKHDVYRAVFQDFFGVEL